MLQLLLDILFWWVVAAVPATAFLTILCKINNRK